MISISNQWHECFATLLSVPRLSFGRGHNFVTVVTIIDKCVGEVFAFNVIDNVVAPFVLESLSLLFTQ